MIDKRCQHPGCTGYPSFGMGRPSGVMRWACAAHRAEIGFTDRRAAPQSEAAAAGPQAGQVRQLPAAAPPAAAPAQQGRLL